MRKLYTIAIFFITCFVHAQDMVLTTAGDTYSGKVLIEIPEQYYESITIKTDTDKHNFKAYEIIEIFKDSIKYVPLKMDSKYKIMKVESEGYLGLYTYRAENTHDFGYKYLYKKDGTGTVVANLGFRKNMADFVQDCPDLAEDVKSGEYKKGDLDDIIKAYNECIESNTIKSKPEAEVVNTESPIIKQIESLMTKVSDQEFKTLLSDIRTKIAQGKKVPSYLIGALKEQADNNDSQEDEINALIDLIE